MTSTKPIVLSTIALLASASLSFAQAPATTTTTGTGTSGTGAAKPKPLPQSDKTLLKNANESIYFLTTICDKAKRGAKSEDVKKLGEKIAGDLNKIYGELGDAGKAYNEPPPPTELKGADKTHSEKLGKLEPDKFDKAFLDDAGKEMKKLARYMESMGKSQTAELKKVGENWAPTVKGFSDEIEKAEKEAAKSK